MKTENMETWKRIKKEQDKKNINDKEFELSLGLKPKTINNWKRGMSSSYMNMLPQLADYFNVSVDYLLGREKSPTDTESMSDDEIKALAKTYIDLEKLAKLSPSQLQALANIIEEFANQNK